MNGFHRCEVLTYSESGDLKGLKNVAMAKGGGVETCSCSDVGKVREIGGGGASRREEGLLFSSDQGGDV